MQKKLFMANTHLRCYPLGVNTGVPVVYDRTAENNNSIIVNKSAIVQQEESIQAQATSLNQNCNLGHIRWNIIEPNTIGI